MSAADDGPCLLIAGFGNPLMADDGAGPAVVERLRSTPLPPRVRVVDGGTDALILSSLWQGEPRIWLIDALRRGAPAGTVHRLDHELLLELPQTHESVHRLSLAECLRWLLHTYPELDQVRWTLWGVEPERVEAVSQLSRSVRAGVDELVACLGQALAGSAPQTLPRAASTHP